MDASFVSYKNDYNENFSTTLFFHKSKRKDS